MLTVTVLVPVLARPHRIAPLVQSFNESVVTEDVEATILFLCTPGDHAQIAELRKRNLWHIFVDGNHSQYARKINAGALATDATWLLTGADDLDFQPGWLREAINVHIATGALVIGTNDGANPNVLAGTHATHSLVHRDYLAQGTIDRPGILLHTGYDHNSCDCEFTETAQARGTWAFAPKALVLHRHPVFDRTIKRDATYNKGMLNARIDRHLLETRRHLWNPNAQRARYAITRLSRPEPRSRWPAR